ncbi:16S rRNA (guanine(966)-N(2))-methyltransferase RsmD [Paludifilum halophilum]|uniref:16S rRNA (Guanine(966)-N(2))-methyltransferase RsmD n=1 Tax=Paludifilum halophilum TaxID=1642702 RepID=A0A235B289_9BACL|nr:16S rRNA (guanine(966)-N(2))-methyltransferase RsmD [Paludifilum halophilum]OYD06436.1 16S rRNA (guanine(966)-N(2))-methyltransferase RsmD [Paludifilum halophilum]
MRIIAGTAKGTRLKTVSGQIRPTTDRVKESLFQIIGPYLDGGWVLDLFAGSGSLGLEALSRGAEQAIFIDQSRSSVDTVRNNLNAAGLEGRAEVYRRDAKAAIRALVRRNVSFRYIFLDPPYRDPILPGVVHQIAEGNLLEEGGVLVAEHAAQFTLKESYRQIYRTRVMRYGDTQIDLYRRREKQEEEVAADEGSRLSREF